MPGLRRWMFGLAGTAFSCVVCYLWLDRPIALLVQSGVTRPEALAQVTRLPDPLVAVAIITFVGLGLWSLSGRLLSRIQNCAWLCSISLMVAVVTKTQLKLIFGRTWPDTWIHNNPSFLRNGVYGFNFFHGGEEYASFPSGHMAVTCAVISVLWVYFPAARTIYTIIALAVGIGLVGANYHFLSDVFAGGFVGISSGWMMTSVWKAHEHFDARATK
jgi:membrane-associated phospholipid phosphatase